MKTFFNSSAFGIREGSALDPPETLSLDSAGALPQTLAGNSVPCTPDFAP